MASDDEPRLSDATMKALQEFLQEQILQYQQEGTGNDANRNIQEDWVCFQTRDVVV